MAFDLLTVGFDQVVEADAARAVGTWTKKRNQFHPMPSTLSRSPMQPKPMNCLGCTHEYSTGAPSRRLLLGPIRPATNRGFLGSCLVISLVPSRSQIQTLFGHGAMESSVPFRKACAKPAPTIHQGKRQLLHAWPEWQLSCSSLSQTSKS